MIEHENRGLIDASSRVLSELLEKPAVKDSIRTMLQNIDPDNSPQLVRTFLWKDPEFSLGLTAALPAIANTIIKSADELLVQVFEKFPQPLLKSFIVSLVDEIDKESLASLTDNVSKLMKLLTPVFQEVLGSELNVTGSPSKGKNYE